ncbi:uncharacterized protein tespa1 [Pholidichthys leucotaenia]
MDSPSSIVRRRAWINSSRQWPTVEESEGPLCSLPSVSIADDDVFSEGCLTGKIENWLLGCGSDACTENSSQQSFESVLQANSFSDDLSLGADASILGGGEITSKIGLEQQPNFKQHSRVTTRSTPHQGLCLPSLNLGHSMASSCLSSSTWKTASSVSEVLQLYTEDAEETLYELGFGCEEPQVTVRIPPRFFTFPSQAQGINFRLFLDSQLCRIREEDPSLSLASRFRQVQVLTEMANAFYSLYSHVSRTPLQKLATPEFNFSSPVERMERFRSSIRSDPRSPVERLKDTVNKMCLYTGSPRGSDSTSPQPSPKKRSSLPEIVDMVLKEKSEATAKLDLGECNLGYSVDVMKEEQMQQITDDICQEMQDTKQTDHVNSGENSVKQADLGCTNQMTALSSSAETVTETCYPLLPCQPELGSCSMQSETRMLELKPATKDTYDLICPQIVESVHRAPFYCQRISRSPLISSESENTNSSCPGQHSRNLHAPVSRLDGNIQLTREGMLGSLSVLEPSGSYTDYCITVTGCEGDEAASCPLKTLDLSHASPFSTVQMCEKSFEERQYLKPLSDPEQFSGNLQQVNSFELEEIHSAGEEDFGQSETPKAATSLLFKRGQHKGEVVRGDSIQSDSSGYADEEISPSHKHSR